ncbi:Electron transfer flavoprotein (Etf), alpha subunit [Desulfatibacillum aliphaticivorans]|uniref:Electron transfer flavoprotein (Etf), alpha subunit n=1 Tax=Desulfatibacillum aliphaticivorans TaxID=218208 RepID=B8FGJ6_DESAL|nr:electron transfer flavoprotein subunit alpha/FixB family protein [Desulfatibacillum aliphaticivorans]ACL04905.1 Electron transfer flavoprotein (Etf), alpha subunit [Desulfatibacillum aliphaticivorans]
MADIFAYIVHKGGKADDSAIELITAAKKIDAGASVTAIVCGAGADLDAVCAEVANTYPKVWKVAADSFANPNGEEIRPVLASLVPAGSIVLFANDSLGLDVAPGLSIKMDGVFLSDVIDFEGMDGAKLTAIRQEYSGQVYAKMDADVSGGAVITVRPGAFAGDEAGGAGGAIEDKAADVPAVGRKYLETVAAEVGDVDITKSEVLLSIGRGIESEDNLEAAFDLAKIMGADVSCSRPIVDSKWLEHARQVGTSGQTVKPKVYMAMGISGAFQHLGGLKGNPFIVAVNKNPKAPIFQVADVGIVGDILEIMPEMQEKLEEMKG